MDSILQLFRSRESDIAERFQIVFLNRTSNGFRKRNIFLSGSIQSLLKKAPNPTVDVMRPWIGNIAFDIANVSRIFIPLPFHHPSGAPRWILTVADFEERALYVLDFMVSQHADQEIVLKAIKPFMNSLNELLNVHLDSKWLPNCDIHFCSKVEDTGVLLMTTLYFTVHQCPVVLRENDIQLFRMKFLRYLQLEYLPL